MHAVSLSQSQLGLGLVAWGSPYPQPSSDSAPSSSLPPMPRRAMSPPLRPSSRVDDPGRASRDGDLIWTPHLDDPVRTSRERGREDLGDETGDSGSCMERQLDRILTVLERQEDDRRLRSRFPLRRRPPSRLPPRSSVRFRPAEPTHPPPIRQMIGLDLEYRLRRELTATSGRDEFDGAAASIEGLMNEGLDLCI